MMQLPNELNLRIFSHSLLQTQFNIRSVSQSFNHLISFIKHTDQIEISSSSNILSNFINIILSTEHIHQIHSHVETLKLNGTKITSQDIIHLNRCKNLTSIDLSGLVINNDIVFQLSQITSLQKINLSECKGLNFESMVSLPDSDDELDENITHIINGGLEHLIHCKSLKTLKLRSQDLINFKIFEQMKNLKKLSVQFRINSVRDISYLSHLEQLEIEFRLISKRFVTQLNQLTGLKKLTIVCHRRSLKMLRIKNLTNLESLIIKKKLMNTIYHYPGSRIKFINLPKLKYLNFFCRILTDSDFKLIIQCIELKSLIIEIESKERQTDFDGIEQLKKLKHLELKGANLNETQMKNISRVTSLKTFVQ